MLICYLDTTLTDGTWETPRVTFTDIFMYERYVRMGLHYFRTHLRAWALRKNGLALLSHTFTNLSITWEAFFGLCKLPPHFQTRTLCEYKSVLSHVTRLISSLKWLFTLMSIYLWTYIPPYILGLIRLSFHHKKTITIIDWIQSVVMVFLYWYYLMLFTFRRSFTLTLI